MVDITTLSENEKNTALEFVHSIYEMSEKARREGILALEDDLDEKVDTSETPVWERLKYRLVRMMVDGIECNALSDVANTLMQSAIVQASEFNETMCIIALLGVLAIQSGDNPRVMLMRVLANLGFDGEREFQKKFEIEIHW